MTKDRGPTFKQAPPPIICKNAGGSCPCHNCPPADLSGLQGEPILDPKLESEVARFDSGPRPLSCTERRVAQWQSADSIPDLKLQEQFDTSRQDPKVEERFARLADRLGVENYIPASERPILDPLKEEEK